MRRPTGLCGSAVADRRAERRQARRKVPEGWSRSGGAAASCARDRVPVRAERLQHHVDRPMRQVQPAAGQFLNDRAVTHRSTRSSRAAGAFARTAPAPRRSAARASAATPRRRSFFICSAAALPASVSSRITSRASFASHRLRDEAALDQAARPRRKSSPGPWRSGGRARSAKRVPRSCSLASAANCVGVIENSSITALKMPVAR